MGMVKSCGPPALHAMASEVMATVHGAVSSIGGAPLPPANAWSGSAAASAQPPASDNFPPGASGTWSATPAAGPDPASVGQLARPLEHEFALALRRATATPAAAAAVRPPASATPMPPVSSAAFAWSPAKPYARTWTEPGTQPKTQGTATRGIPLDAGHCPSHFPHQPHAWADVSPIFVNCTQGQSLLPQRPPQCPPITMISTIAMPPPWPLHRRVQCQYRPGRSHRVHSIPASSSPCGTRPAPHCRPPAVTADMPEEPGNARLGHRKVGLAGVLMVCGCFAFSICVQFTDAPAFFPAGARDSATEGGGPEEAYAPQLLLPDASDWLLHRVACGPGDDQYLFELVMR